MREDGWDWDRPFDEDFVRGAVSREDSGEVRADRAARIASQHRTSSTWRGDRPQLDTRHRGGRTHRPPGGRGSERRRNAIVLTTVLAVLGAFLYLGTRDDRGGPPLLVSPAAPTTFPPVPADARPSRILPLPAALPGTGGYRFATAVGTEDPVRWDPCRPIHYVTRAGSTPSGGSALVQDAFDQLSAATGLAFADDGVTGEDPGPDRAAVLPERYGERFAPVLVSWSDESESPLLAGDIAAYAGPVTGDDGGGPRLASGQLVLDAQALSGGSRDAQLGIVLHELGHLVGLDHVTDRTDTMYSEVVPGPPLTRYTPGAARGLRVLGDGPCFS